MTYAQLVSIGDPSPTGIKVIRTYDNAGRLLSETQSASGATVTYTYDPDLGLRERMDLDGQVVASYVPDVLSRLWKIVVPGQPAERVFEFGYDEVSRRESLVLPNGLETTYAFDGLDQLLSVTTGLASDPLAAAVVKAAYGYDSAGNRSSKQVGALTETYRYDVVDRLVEASRGESGVNSFFGYDAVGNRTSAQTGGTPSAATYGQGNRLTSTVSGGAGGTLRLRGHLDEPGRVEVNGQPARLLPSSGAEPRETWPFDADLPIEEGSTPVTVDAWDRRGNHSQTSFSITTTPTSATSFQYDLNGNLELKVGPQSITRFVWDAENRLSRVCQGPTDPTPCTEASAIASFRYDAFGRRVAKVGAGRSYVYAYDGQDTLRETITESGNTTTYLYLHGPGIDEPLARQNVTPGATGDTWEFLHADGLGSIIATTSSSGTVTQTFNYSAWGEIECPAAAPNCAQEGGYRFTGREWDPETGLYYFRARYYDPRFGRFLSEDPIGFLGGINFYTYVENNPPLLRDPFGLESGNLNNLVPGPNGETAANSSNSALPQGGSKVLEAFVKNYMQMRDANTIGADKYFHCMAHCEGARTGRGGAWMSGMMGEARELTDQFIKGDSEW